MFKRSRVIANRGWALAGAATGMLAAACGMEPSVAVEESDAKLARVAEPVADSYIVVLDTPPGTARGAVDVAGLAAELGDRYAAIVDRTFAGVGMFAATMSEADAVAMSRRSDVALVQENGMKYAVGSQTGATWGIDRIDQRDRPLDQTYGWTDDGTGVTAYVVDTGVRVTHGDFGGRASAGFSAIDDGQGSNDCHGHGTHVAGTVGSTTYGVAKAVAIKAVRVLNCAGSGTDAEVIAGIDFVRTDHSGPAVANMSLGGEASPALDAAVQNAIAAGVTFVVAAGNESQNACNVSPSRTPEAVTVGATGSNDARAGYSNFGTCLDIFAPGSSIKSLWNSNDGATSTISGTSMASPHVAGAAALVLDAHPEYTPAQVRDALVAAATPGKVTSPGSGSPNVLLYTGGGGLPPPPEPGPRSDTFSGSALFFGWAHQSTLTVQPGTRVRVVLTTTSGNANLYVRFGAQPTASAYDCRPNLAGTATETCDLLVPAGASQAYVSVRDAGFFSAFTGTRAWVQP
jgi:serine protease